MDFLERQLENFIISIQTPVYLRPNLRRERGLLQWTIPQQDAVADGPMTSEMEFCHGQAEKLLNLQDLYIHSRLPQSVNYHSKLDDIQRYGISASQEAELWKLQTGTLAAAITSRISINPLSSAVEKDWLPDHTGFKLLSRVAGDVLRNIAICNFDNILVLFEHQRESFDNNDLSLARDAILADTQTGTNGSRTAETESDISEEQRRRFSCALVDYVAAVTARCASHNIVDESWHALCMTSLARLTAKLKFLAVDTEDFASRSLENGQKVLAKNPTYADKIDKDNLAQVFSASSWALESLRFIFGNLKCEKRPGVLINAFNIGAIVWETGWKDIIVMLSEDQSGKMSGTSVRSILWSTQGAFDTLVEVLSFRNVDPPRLLPARAISDHAASIVIGYQTLNRESSRPVPITRDLKTLGDVVLFMVPLICMQPTRLLQLNRTSGFDTEPVMGFESPYVRAPMTWLSAFAALRVNFSYSHIFDHFARTENVFRGLSGLEGSNPAQRLSMVESLAKKPIKAEEESTVAQNWAIEEKSIVVRRRMYVITTMSACGVLVVGGILAGLLVGERIPGVDPFNIATFAWVLAAFIILIAKSLSVREWPWRDFLRGQVPCRSVSELHTVTGIDEQAILEYLLANEAHTSLCTRGPFNLLFTRRSDDGFSIDVKMDLRTLIDSGIVVFRVAANAGQALVCLDLRRGVEGRTSISHSDGPREGERLLGCFDFPESIRDSSDVRLQTLSQSMTWRRILGIYDRMDKKFR